MRNRIIVVLSFVFVISGCLSSVGSKPNEEDGVTSHALDKQALLALLSGSTVYQGANDIVQVGFYEHDNTMTGNVWGSQGNLIDEGSWMVDEQGQFCNQWQGVWSQGEGQTCYQVLPGDAKNQYMMVPDSTDKEILQVLISTQDEDEFE